MGQIWLTAWFYEVQWAKNEFCILNGWKKSKEKYFVTRIIQILDP